MATTSHTSSLEAVFPAVPIASLTKKIVKLIIDNEGCRCARKSEQRDVHLCSSRESYRILQHYTFHLFNMDWDWRFTCVAKYMFSHIGSEKTNTSDNLKMH